MVSRLLIFLGVFLITSGSAHARGIGVFVRRSEPLLPSWIWPLLILLGIVVIMTMGYFIGLCAGKQKAKGRALQIRDFPGGSEIWKVVEVLEPGLLAVKCLVLIKNVTNAPPGSLEESQREVLVLDVQNFPELRKKDQRFITTGQGNFHLIEG